MSNVINFNILWFLSIYINIQYNWYDRIYNIYINNKIDLLQFIFNYLYNKYIFKFFL